MIGLVGCGRWGRHILRDLIGLGCEVAVASHSSDHRQQARDAGARLVVETISALPSVDGFIVATPTSTHADVVEELLDTGLPIFCEKPLVDDGVRAARLAEQGAGRLFVMDKWRYHPAIERLAELIRRQALGPVTGLRTLRVQPAELSTDVDPIWTLAPHDLGIALELLGHVPVPRAAVLEYDGSRIAGLVGVLGDAPSMVLEVSARYPSHRREIRVLCADGVAMFSDADAGCVRVYRRKHDVDGGLAEERLPISTELPLLRELRAFVHHLDGGPPPRSSATEAAAVVAALTTLRRLAGAD